jgi:SAM-dependent methyltransferase
MKLYSELAEYYYEIEKPGRSFQDEIEFVHEVLQKYKVHSLIDLGCGSGEHIASLKRAGYSVKGIDSSEQMLQVARKRFPECQFAQGTLQNFQNEQQVECITCLFGTFNYLIADEDIRKALKNIHSLLKTGGIAIFEVWNSSPIRKIQRKPIGPVSMSKIGNVVVKRNRGFKISSSNPGEKGENIVEVNFIFHLDEKVVKDKHIMRVFSLEELKGFLEESRFQILEIYGGFKMQKFFSHTGRMLLICKKKS